VTHKTQTEALHDLILNPRRPVVFEDTGANVLAHPLDASKVPPASECYHLPPIYPERLGDRQFTEDHNIRFPYIVGEMARGIATPRMVVAAAKAGLLGFYGSAGLQVEEIRLGLTEIRQGLPDATASWGANVIHTPQQPGYEAEVIDLFLEQSVRRVSASAYMRLSPEIVRYTCLGLTRASNGEIKRQNHVFAKVSRAEVAEQFMAPAPQKILDQLVQSGHISAEQARLGALVPVAADITAEADSGGHTDNRPASVVFSSLTQARARISRRHSYPPNTIRIGLAGGIATPHAVASAFQMGAAYVLTGSVNQSAVESGLSQAGRQSLAGAGPADVMMAPAADMFEQGVKVQVLKRGTLFAMRGEKLYAMYRSGAQFDHLPPKDKAWVESVLGEPFESAWQATRAYLLNINPDTVAKADEDGNKRFALVCRRYLFMGAQWAREGVEERKSDFQIWCGPAMGAFNEWVKGTPLEPLVARTVKQIAWNLLEGGAVLTRAGQLRSVGVAVPADMFSFSPRIYT
jgi:PfaD family protein